MQLGGKYFTESELRKLGFKKIGKNVRIHNRASIYGPENISLGDNIRIDDFTVIIATGPLNIGKYVSIHNFCYLVSKYGITLDDYVTLAPSAKIFSSSDDYLGHYMTGSMVPKVLTGGDHGAVVLKKHVIVGSGSIVLPNIILGEGASVGALSLVKSNLDSWGVYAGIPAIKIKKRNKKILKMESKLYE